MDKLADIITQAISKKIVSGDFGVSGATFLSTREFSAQNNCSLVTAQRVMDKLKNLRLICLIGHKYFLTYKKLDKDSALSTYFSDSRLIGVHIIDIKNPYFASLASKVEYYARQRGFKVIIASSDNDCNCEHDILNMFFSLRVAGIITTPSKEKSLYQTYTNFPLPLVFLSQMLKNSTVDCVTVDNLGAAENVAMHFISQGYKRFYYIGLVQKPSSPEDLRLSGFIKQLKQNKIDFDEEKNVIRTNENYSNFTAEVQHILKSIQEPTAFFCYHDLLAIKLLDLCKTLGIDVPNQVGIAGFDNLDITQISSPPLTTVGYRTDIMAKEAVDLLIAQTVSHQEKGTHSNIMPVLLTRKSTHRLP